MRTNELFEALVELRKKNDEGGDYPYDYTRTIRAIEFSIHSHECSRSLRGITIHSEDLASGESEKRERISIFVPKKRIPAEVWTGLEIIIVTRDSWRFRISENNIVALI